MCALACFDVLPVCCSQCYLLCFGVLGKWHQDLKCQQTGQAGEEGQLCSGDGTGQCGGGDGEEDEREAESYHSQPLSSSMPR